MINKTHNSSAGLLFSNSKELKELGKTGMLKGTLTADKQLSLISGCTDLKAAVEGAIYLQVSTVHACLLERAKGRKFCGEFTGFLML